MGVIPGHIKDEVVVVGNHRDGKSYADYNSLFALKQHSSLGKKCTRFLTNIRLNGFV